MYRTNAVRILAAGVLALSTAAALPQAASAQQSTPQGNEGAGPKLDWSDNQLRKFAGAAIEVQETFAEWRPRIEQTQDTAKQEELRQQANEAALEAIRDEGLSVRQYNQMNQAIQAEPELYDKVVRMMEEQQ